MPGVLGVKGSQRKALDANPSLAADNPVASMADVGSSEPATTDGLGAVIIATAPVDPDEPVAVGDNDPRLSDARTPTGHTHPKADVGLSNVDNTSDADKPVSTAQGNADALKVAKAGDAMTGPLVLPVGSAPSPAARIGDAGLGLFRIGSGILGIAAASSEVARASSSEFRVHSSRILRATTLLIDETLRYSTTTIPAMFTYDGALVGDEMDATQTSIFIEEAGAPPSGTTYPCAAVIAEGTADEEWVLIHARSAGADYTVQRGYPIGGGVGKAHSYGDSFRIVGDGSAVDVNGNPDCHNFVLSNVAKTVNIFANTINPASGPQTIDLWLPTRSSIGAWAAPADGKEFKLLIANLSGHTMRVRDPVSNTIDVSLNGAGNNAVSIIFSQTGLRYQAESRFP